MGKEGLVIRALNTGLVVVLAFAGGFLTHFLYQRWQPALSPLPPVNSAPQEKAADYSGAPGAQHRAAYLPLAAPVDVAEAAAELPLLMAREVDKIRAQTGKPARVRGRVFRVGHSAKSNTYFVNFGPTREALTAVIFSSAVELFEKNRLAPKGFENKDVEITGQIKDHPQYGLEIILEHPKQIKMLN